MDDKNAAKNAALVLSKADQRALAMQEFIDFRLVKKCNDLKTDQTFFPVVTIQTAHEIKCIGGTKRLLLTNAGPAPADVSK